MASMIPQIARAAKEAAKDSRKSLESIPGQQKGELQP
jgi:hypothetical protein